MLTKLSGIEIKKMACCLPKNIVSVYDYANGLVTEKDAKRLARGTGFSKLRITDANATTADLCYEATCLFGGDNEAIDGLIFVTQTPDYYLPATSHVLQEKLGLSHSVLCLDVNQGCSGYVQGLYLATLLVATKQCKNVLLLAGDTISKLTSSQDRATRCIFGDAGTATLITEGTDDIAFNISSFGERAEAIIVPNSRHRIDENAGDSYLQLDGMGIMNFTLEDVPVSINELLKFDNLNKNDIGLYACHQANKLILASLADKLGVPSEKLPFTAGEIGNTSSASIPLVLSTQVDRNLRSVLCCGFGVGLSIGSCVADFSKTQFMGVKEL